MSDKANTPTAYERKVLAHLVKYQMVPLGNAQISVAGALRRLEKKGLAGKGRFWYATQAGEALIKAGNQTTP